MLGDDTSTLTTLGDLSSSAAFSNQNMTQINFSAKDATGNTWSVPNGITGEYTLNNFDLYTAVLTEEQMKAYALSCPGTGCGLSRPAGPGHPADAPPQGLNFRPPARRAARLFPKNALSPEPACLDAFSSGTEKIFHQRPFVFFRP